MFSKNKKFQNLSLSSHQYGLPIFCDSVFASNKFNKQISSLLIQNYQIPTKWGPASRFVVKANSKPL